MELIPDDKRLEAFRLFLTGLVGISTLLGYSYGHHYFRQFGVSLPAQGFGLFDLLFRGAYFLIDWRVLGGAILVSGIFTVLAVNIARLRHSSLIVALVVLAMVFLASASIWMGKTLAEAHVYHMVTYGSGRSIRCEIHRDGIDDSQVDRFAGLIESLSAQNRLRFISRDEDYHYVAIVASEGGTSLPLSKSYAIPNRAIVFCDLFYPIRRPFIERMGAAGAG